MRNLINLLSQNENNLMKRILEYAIENGYAKYTSTLEEAWRVSIQGLTSSILQAIELSPEKIELSPEEDFQNDPVAEFGVKEARLHRNRGVSLQMFLGLFKYYLQSYLDLIKESNLESDRISAYSTYVTRCFDRIEIAYCSEWTELSKDKHVESLQVSNRIMTNEKNAYLTVFESLFNPVFLIGPDKRIRNLNHAAAKLIDENAIPGGSYYAPEVKLKSEVAFSDNSANMPESVLIGKDLATLLPWLTEAISNGEKSETNTVKFECSIKPQGIQQDFEGNVSDMLDVSQKFLGSVVILNDVSKSRRAERARQNALDTLRKTLDEVKELKGLLPICAHCKKVRDDTGYWNQIENYISVHTKAEFSHSLCPSCATTLYPDYINEEDYSDDSE